MVSERVQRQIGRLLDQAEEAADALDWARVDAIARSVLNFDAENADARAFLQLAEPHSDGAGRSGDSLPPGPGPARVQEDSHSAPASFANDRYRVTRFLGEGGKKRVYLAHDSLLDREVAFALIKTEGFDQTSRERISREAQAMGRLGVHPNIVAVLDLGQEDDGTPYMVTELMGGGDVEGLLAEAVAGASAGPPITTPEPPPILGGGKDEPSPWQGEGLGVGRNGLPLDRAIQISKQVCEGLQFAHARGIVHRDLKPGNVWLTSDPSTGSGNSVAKIGDFGLAVMTDRSRLTREGMMVGTVSYMPPEQATGGEITPKADLYSLGAMLYEMVTGRPPFLGDDEIAIIGQHINTPPVAPTWHNGACPRPLEALVMRLLSKDPAERPESAQDVFNALDAIDLTARGETVERASNSLDSLAGGVFVGRHAEMDQLKAALEDVLGGRGRLITLMGEPGIGKTRTSEEFTTYAGLRGAEVLWGRCYEGGGAPPYWPWVQAIRSYVRLIDAEVLHRELGAGASVVSEVVSDISERLPGLEEPPEANDAESARFRLFDSVTAFLKTASQSQPMVIVLDDLHWSDAPSLLLLEFIARELSGSRLLILATYRDMELNRRHPLSQSLGELTRERLFERVLLRGLTSDDIARFMELASGVEPPPALVDAVFTQTEGNPLFVTEVTRLLVQGGDLTAESAVSRSSWTVRIPEGVREVIGRRLDRLSERCNDTLTIAAVIGRQFELDHLRELVEDVSEDRLFEVLEEALAARVIEELPDQIGRYQFSHALIQETLIDEISITRRVRMDARIGETLERIYGDTADAHADELVAHFDRAQTLTGPDKVIHYSLVAGERSLAAHGSEEAVNHFERALAAWGGPEKELDETGAHILSGLGRAQGVAFEPRRVPAAMGHLARAFDYFAENGMINDAVVAAGYRLHPKPGALRDTEPMLRRALEIVEPGSQEEARLQCRLGWVLGRETGDLDGSNEVLDRALATARSAGDVNTEAMAESYRGAAAWASLKYRESLDASRRAVALATQVDNIKTLLTAQNSLAIAKMGLGETDGADAEAEQSLELAERLQDRTEQADSLWINAHIALLTGDFKAALEFNSRGLERNAEGGRLLIQSLILHAETGDLEGAFEVIDVMDRVHREAWPGTEGTTAAILTYAAATLARVSDEPRLTEITRQAADVSFNSPGLLPVFIQQARVSLCLLAVVEGDAVEADRLYHEVDLESGIIVPVHILSNDHIRGLLAAAAGRFDVAERHMTDTCAFYEPRGYRPPLAWALSDYAEMLLDRTAKGAEQAQPGDREKAVDLQNDALAISRELGMRPLTERILARREMLRA